MYGGLVVSGACVCEGVEEYEESSEDEEEDEQTEAV